MKTYNLLHIHKSEKFVNLKLNKIQYVVHRKTESDMFYVISKK